MEIAVDMEQSTGLGRCAWWAILVWALAVHASAWAENPASMADEPMAVARGNTPSSAGLHRRDRRLGWMLAVGNGERLFGGEEGHDLLVANASFGRVVTRMAAEDHWWRGNAELIFEVFAGGQYEPKRRYLVGVTGFIRYNFVTHPQWRPFTEIGLGPAYSNIRQPDLSTRFQFNDQFGLGTHYFLEGNLAVTAQYRLMHVSNGGIKKPNKGVNAHLIMLGTSWFF